ncbi:MAG: TIGR04282 family arsenosugar biosynthesis glycosyltransferase [Deltaproteobacteria bacterium]|nr:TIGR04282 family arsenosugar biosynthesis glycosyltransferase [Deltaproteobacteria bacterium]
MKTRLTPPLTPIQAAGLYACFIRDTFNMASRLGGVDLYAACAPEGLENGCEPLIGIVPEGVTLFFQRGDNIGRRMFNVFDALFKKGYEKVSIIGSDSPDLPRSYVEEAFALLDGLTDVVLGPAMDGGYYLIAMDAPSAIPFRMIPWSIEKALEMTIENLRSSAMSFKLLKPWNDIDTPEYLRLLDKNADAPESSRFMEAILNNGK